MKALKPKQYNFICKLWYCPGGNTSRGSMSSLFDAEFDFTGIIIRTEEHMF